MINAWTIFFLLASHFVADFIFQTNEIATNKSKSSLVLTQHVAIYTVAMWLILSLPLFLFDIPVINVGQFASFIVINSFLHWITDFFTSRIAREFYLEDRQKAFWNVIGIDQMIHTCTLVLTANYML
jgi:hypothetical protein